MIERILYTSLIDISLPNGPGVNERVFVTEMMRRLGDRFRVVIPTPSRGLPELLAPLDVALIPVGASVRTPRGWIQARTSGTFIINRNIEEFRPDLVVMRTGAFSLSQYLAVRRSPVPYVLKTTGDVTLERFFELRPQARPLRKLNQFLSSRLCRGALCIDLVSESAREGFLTVLPELEGRSHVIGNAVDLEDFKRREATARRAQLGIGLHDFVVGFVGNFPIRRGGREVIDVVAGLRDRLPVKGLVVGDSGDVEALDTYARELGVRDSVVLFGRANYEDVPELMSCMDIGLSILRPKESAASEQKVRQYLACGLCLVGTSPSNDFVRTQPFARLVDGPNADDVTEAVESLLGQGRSTLTRLGGQARRFAEQSLSIVTRNDLRFELWERALQAHRRREAERLLSTKR